MKIVDRTQDIYLNPEGCLGVFRDWCVPVPSGTVSFIVSINYFSKRTHIQEMPIYHAQYHARAQRHTVLPHEQSDELCDSRVARSKLVHRLAHNLIVDAMSFAA